MEFRVFYKSINAILDILFPVRCFVCRKDGTPLCAKCLTLLPRAPSGDCSRDCIYALFDYRNEAVRHAIWSLKYRGARSMARTFAQALYDEFLEELGSLHALENFRDPLLIPIPLSRKRTRERGFNQAELIAREFAALDASLALSADALQKIKDTPSQASLAGREARLNNLKNCFGISDDKNIRGKNIILIDDVSTTGATIREAQKTLYEAGARKVIAFVVAH